VSSAPAARDPARERLIGYACGVGIVLIWTGFILISRAGMKGTLGSLDLAALRFTVSGLVMLPFYLLHARKLIPFGRAAVLAFTAGLAYANLAYAGFKYAPAAHGGVLLPGALPIWTAILAAFFLHERMNGARLASLAIVLAGIAMIGWHGFSGAEPGAWRGDLVFLCASLCWATYTVLVRKWRVPAIPATAAVAVLSAVAFLPVYVVALPSRLAEAGWGEMVFQAVYQGIFAVVIAGILFTRAVGALGAGTTTMITAVIPATAALGAVPLLGEQLSALALAGVVAVSIGMVLGVRAGR
jgi:drug/metabolite transporter (DMT)-like permease